MTIIEQLVLHIARSRGSTATTAAGARRYVSGAMSVSDLRLARRALGILPDPRLIEEQQRARQARVDAVRSYPECQQAARDAASPRRMGAIRAALTRATRAIWTAATPDDVADGIRRRQDVIRGLRLRLRRAELWAAHAYAPPAPWSRGLGAVINGAVAPSQVPSPALPRGCAPLHLDGRLSSLPHHSQRERRDLSPRSGVSWVVAPVVSGRVSALRDQDYEVRFADSGQVCHRPDRFRRRDLDVAHAEHVVGIPSYGLLVGSPRVAQVADASGRVTGSIDGTDRMAYRVGLREGEIAAPEGWAWCIDGEGVHLRACDGAGDHHPDAAEVMDGDPGAMTHIAAESHAIRLQQAREREARVQDLAGVYVCWTDARRSGYCAQGIRSWAGRHGVDVSRHVPASPLYRRHGADERLRRLCTRALQRHQMEMERGYADLADHVTPV